MTAATKTEASELLLFGNAGTDGISTGFRMPVSLSARITVAANRQNALAILRRQGRHASARHPALIVLDLEDHGEQAWGLLREIKGDSQLRRIPIIVLGSGNSSAERTRAYELNANCYLPRPEDERRLALLLERIQDFWLTRVRLPAG